MANNPYCCGCMTVEACAKLAAIISLAYSIIVFNPIAILFNILLVVGIFSRQRQPFMIKAYLIWQVIYMVGLLVLLIYGIVLVTYSCDASDMFLSSNNELLSCDDVKAAKKLVGGICLGIAAVSLVVVLYCSIVILRFYRQLSVTFVQPMPAYATSSNFTYAPHAYAAPPANVFGVPTSSAYVTQYSVYQQPTPHFAEQQQQQKPIADYENAGFLQPPKAFDG